MERFKGTSTNHRRVYDYEHSIVLKNAPKNSQSTADHVEPTQENTNFSNVILSHRQTDVMTSSDIVSSRPCIRPHSLTSTYNLSQEGDNEDEHVGRVQSWKAFASSTYSRLQDSLNVSANGTLAQARTWMRSMRSKLDYIVRPGPGWLVHQLSGQRWVVEISVHYVTKTGLHVVDTTESEFSSKEHAERYACEWKDQFRLEGCQIPFNIKIYLKDGGQSQSTSTTTDVMLSNQ